ncbi:MAG: SCO family protein [Chloroflexi bacterium]|nr:MAG: SCO family protein [Chloroflexota bacterium]
MTSVADSPNSDEKKPTSGLKTWLLIVGGLFAGLFVGLVVISSAIGTPIIGGHQFHGTVIRAPEPANNFTFTGADGQPVSLRDFRGKVVLLYFGYTYCPDVCPATMVELKQAVEEIGNKADRVQVILISVDPERDTPEQLQAYANHFHESFLGLTGTEEEILGLTTQYGVFFEKHEGSVDSGYLIDHTATVTVIDRDGHLRLLYPFDTPSEGIADDLRYLVRH